MPAVAYSQTDLQSWTITGVDPHHPATAYPTIVLFQSNVTGQLMAIDPRDYVECRSDRDIVYTGYCEMAPTADGDSCWVTIRGHYLFTLWELVAAYPAS